MGLHPGIIARRRFYLGGGASTLALDWDFLTATINSDLTVTADTGNANNAVDSTYTNRTNHARQWNADGVLEYAPCNICKNKSESFAAADWNQLNLQTPVGGQADPLGGTNAYLLTLSNAGGTGAAFCRILSQVMDYGGDWVASFYLKDGSLSARYVCIITQGYGGDNGTTTFDLVSGTVSAASANHIATIEAVPGATGWYRCEIVATLGPADVTGNIGVAFSSAGYSDIFGNSPSQTLDGSKSFYIFGAQIRPAIAPSTYVKTTASSSPVYGPRVGSRSRKPVTNLNSYPENLDNSAYWSQSGLTSISTGQTDPFGGTNAQLLLETGGASNTHGLSRTTAEGIASGETLTLSVYAKAQSRNWLRLTDGTNASWYNISTGELGSTAGTVKGRGIAPVGDGTSGWYRCWFTWTAAGANPIIYYRIANADTATAYAGDTSSGLYLFGANLNRGGIEDYVGVGPLSESKTFTSGANVTATANSAVAPDGTTTADSLVTADTTVTSYDSRNGAYVLSNTYMNTVNNQGTWTFFAKAGSYSVIRVNFQKATAINASFTVDLSDGSISNQTSSGNYTFDRTATTYWGNGWYRVEATITNLTSSGSTAYRLQVTPHNGSDVSDGSSNVYVWGGQLTKDDYVYPYVGMPQTAFVKGGYQAEAAATNLVTDSEDFSAAAWSPVNTDSVTVTTNQSVFVDGVASMDKIEITDTTTETHGIFDTITSLTSGGSYVSSCFVRADEVRYVGLRHWASNENFITALFDLYAGSAVATDVGTTSGTISGYGIIPCGNGCFRIWISGTVTGTTLYPTLITSNSAAPTFDLSGNVSYAGTAGDAFYAGGFQFETGTYPSSYIRTSGGTGTRSSDILTETTLSWFDPTTATIVNSGTRPQVTTSTDIDWIFRETATAYISSDNNDGDHLYIIDGTLQVRIDAGNTAGVGTTYKKAAAWNNGTSANAAILGQLGTEDTSFTLPTPVELFFFQSQTAAFAFLSPVWLRTFQYYSERKSDADITTLSQISDDGTAWRDEVDA